MYTPGPWKVQGDAIYGAPDVRSKHRNGRPHIAKITSESGSRLPGFDNGLLDEEGTANARLIAAAPLMHAALKDIRDFLKRSGYDTRIVDAALQAAVEA